MKRFLIAIALIALFAVSAGCSSNLPKPVNANGTTNVSVAVDEAVFSYGVAMHTANKYIATCRAAPSTLGCNDVLIHQITDASDKAWTALLAAQTSVKNLPPGAAGLDAALADAQAALLFLQSLTAQVPK